MYTALSLHGRARRRKKKGEEDAPQPLERKITYLPQAVTSLDLSTQPGGPDGEDWSLLGSKNGEPFDATARIDCEMLEYALQKGVPHVLSKAAEELDKPVKSKKRKSDVDEADRTSSSQASGKKRKKDAGKENDGVRSSTQRKRIKAKKLDALAESASTAALPSQTHIPSVRPVFRMPPSLDLFQPLEPPQPTPLVVELDSEPEPEPTSDEEGLFVVMMASAIAEEQTRELLLDDDLTYDATPERRQTEVYAHSSELNAAESRPMAEGQDLPKTIRAKRLAHFGKRTETPGESRADYCCVRMRFPERISPILGLVVF